MKKRIITLICAVMCLFVSVAVSAKSYTIKNISDRYDLLVGLGITEEIESLDEAVKTSFFTDSVKSLFGENTDSYELKSFEAKLEKMELNPDDALTINNASRIAVTALGYDAIMKNSGYLSMANGRGLLKGVENKDALTYGDAAAILYNMLEEPMCRVEYANGLTRNDSNFLNDFLNLEKTTGLVTAVKGQTLSGVSVGLDNRIAINSEIYLTADIDTTGYFARNVICYYQDDDGVKTVKYIYSDSENEETIDVTLITETKFSNGKYTIKYEDLREKQYKAEITPKFVSKNGEKVDLGTVDMKTMLDFAYGNIKLIDSDDDDKYDIMLIESYENYHASFVGSDVIYDKNGKDGLSFDFDDTDCIYEFIKDGKVVKYSDIAEGNVLSVYKSNNGKYIKIYISENTATGLLEQKESISGGKTKLIIDGFPYYTSLDANKLQVGDNTIFYLDVNGVVAGYDITNIVRSTDYGFMVKLYSDESDIIHTRIFTKADSKLVDLKSKTEQLYIEYKGKAEKYTYEQLKAKFTSLFNDDGSFKPQVVQFASNGVYLTKLVVAADRDDDQTYFQQVSTGKTTYGQDRIAGCVMDSTGEQTWVLAVPPEDQMNDASKYTVNYPLTSGTSYDYEMYDIDDFYMAKVFIIRVTTTDRVYNTNAIDRGIGLGVVQNVKAIDEWDEDDCEVKRHWEVTLYWNGAKNVYNVMDSEKGLYVGSKGNGNGDVTLEKTVVDTRDGKFLSKGDVVQPYVEGKNLIAVRRWYILDGYDYDVSAGKYVAKKNIMPIGSTNEMPGYCASSHGTNAGFDSGSFLYAQVKKISNNYIVTDASNPSINSDYWAQEYMTRAGYPLTYKNMQGYIYDKASGEVEIADKSDIKEGDDIVFAFVYFQFRTFVIFR